LHKLNVTLLTADSAYQSDKYQDCNHTELKQCEWQLVIIGIQVTLRLGVDVRHAESRRLTHRLVQHVLSQDRLSVDVLGVEVLVTVHGVVQGLLVEGLVQLRERHQVWIILQFEAEL
jgi:hypothetical protein